MIADFLASRIEGYSSNSLDERTARYLDNYWVDRESLKRDWGPLLESAFKRASGKVSVAGNLVADFLQGGVLFTEDEFSSFVARAKESRATRFAVVEDIGQSDWSSLKEFDFFRFSYPVGIGWGDMTHSSILAQDVFERPIRCFFVIADNGKVGKFANNDADPPYDLIFHEREASL